MPFLNSFGRYIQRTGYGALSPAALKHALPVFLLDPRAGNYAYQAGSPTHNYAITSPGNTTDAYAVGALGADVTYHIEQWIRFQGRPGFLDTTWLAYNGFAHHTGHLFVGKLVAINEDENEAPFVMRDINDASAVLPVVAGVHDYALDETGARWGAKYAQFFGRFVTEVQYVGNSSGVSSFDGAYNFALGNLSDRSFQWRAAYADPAHPWELGVFGETGTLGWAGSQSGTQLNRDNYTLIAPYVMKDPRPGAPGVRLQYATTRDSNPGLVATPNGLSPFAGATNGSYMVGSLNQMYAQDRLMANVTYFHANMPLSPVGASPTAGSAGLSYAIAPYVRIFAAGTTLTHQKPYWSYLFWLTPPLRERR